MKKKMIRAFAAILVIGIAVMAILYGQWYLDKKIYCHARLRQSIEAEQITVEALEQFTLWEEERDVTFSNPMLQKNCTGECVYVVGTLDKLQEWDILDGTLFLDEKGVIITNTAAQQLFHSEHVAGQKLQYEEKWYIVRGVVKGERSKMYLTALIPNEDGYEWTASLRGKKVALKYISYVMKRKKCLFKKMPEILQFQLEKNGYPEIDMIL